ncbi:MAG TPA: hypothetical protein PLI95_14555, partial [Polyangiaceae bacterium]|nr:hypothetical protein [Polyangiaceae bacterium]
MKRLPLLCARLAGLLWISIATGCGGSGSTEPDPGSATDAAFPGNDASEAGAHDDGSDAAQAC